MIFKTIKSSINDISIVGSTLTEIGKLKLDATNISGYATVLKGLSTQQAQLVMSTKGLTTAQQQAVLSQISLAYATGTLTTSQMTSALITETRNEADARALLLNTGLISSETAEATATNVVTAAKLRELVATGQLTQAEAQLLATKAGVTLANQTEASSFSKLGTSLKNIGNSIKSIAINHPVLTAITVVIGAITTAITIAEKKNEEFIESQKELIEKIDENISKYDEEISSLDSLQEKLQNAKGNKEALASIQSELNQVIGDTPGLLNEESNAYEIANQKINDRIERLKELRRLELEDKVTAQKEIFNNTLVDNAMGIDHKFDYFSNHKIIASDTLGSEFSGYLEGINANRFETLQSIFEALKKNGYGNGEKSNAEIWKELIDSYGGAMLDVEEIQNYFDNQTEYAQKILSDYVNNAESIFSKEELNSIIANLVEGGYAQDLEGITDIITSLVENDELKTTINDYYESLYNDDVDSDALYQNIKGQFDTLVANYPELKGILDNYFNSIGKDIETGINNVSSNPDEITDSFSKAFNSSDFSEQKQSLLELAKAGELTPETIESTEEYNTLLTQTGLSAESAKDKIYDLLTVQEKLAGANNGIDDLKSSYEEFKDLGFVTAQTLEELPDVFKSLDGYDVFAEIVGNPQSGVDAIQEAFNDIVKEYLIFTQAFKSKSLISDDIEERAHATSVYIANLEQMGVTNAEDVVESVKKCLKESLQESSKLLDGAYEEYIDYLNGKEGCDIEYLNSVNSKNGQLINSLGEQYQTDYDNWIELISKKEKAYKEFVSELKSSGFGETESVLSKYSTSTDESAYDTAVRILEEANSPSILNQTRKTDFSVNYDTARIYTDDVVAAALQYKTNYELFNEANENLNFSLANFDSVSFDTIDYDGLSSESNSNSSDSEKQFDWIERATSKMDKSLDELDSKVANTYSTWIDRNKDLSASISKTTEAIALQKNAANAYMNEASKIGLDSVYVGLIQNGALDISEISDEDLADKISEYQSLYDSAQNCLKTAQELENSLNELQYNEQWELFSTEIDADINEIEEYINTWQSKLDKAELQGRFANSSYYENMRALTENQLEDLTTKANKLQSILGNMTQGTEAYDTLFAEFLSIEGEIRDLENQIIEFNNNIRDLNWEIFEYLEDSISRITDETEYLNNLINESDLFDEGGNFTEYGDASLGLYAVAYDTYKQQAEDYYEEVQELQRQLVNGAGKDVLEQYYKMVDAHQDAILAAKDEKKAILDLVEEGYNAQLDALNKIIDKKKEAMSEISDLYNYQKSIEEKTSNIASLKKQEKAFLNDDSEYGMSQLQKIQLELSNAEKDLDQTEREQFLQDSQKMLDELYDNYEEFLNSRLDNEDALLQEIISNISGKGDEINATLNQVASDYGTFISDSITSIFDANSPFTSGLTNIATNVAGTTNAINTLISQVSGIAGALNVKTNAGTGSTGSTSSISSTSGSSSNNNSQANSTSSNATSTATANSNSNSYDGIFIYKKYYKQNLNTNTSVVDRLKSNDIDASWSARAQYWSKIFGGAYTGSESQNIKFLNWLKSNGYKSGTSSATKGLHLFDEEGLGSEVIITKEGALRQFNTGDTVFSDEATKKLWEFTQDPEGYMSKLGISGLNYPQVVLPTPKTPDMSNLIRKDNSSQDVTIKVDGMNINLPNVKNYKDFRNELIRDKDFTDAMGTYVNNKIMGKNSLEHYKYSHR